MTGKHKNRLIQLLSILFVVLILSLSTGFLLKNTIESGETRNTITLSEGSTEKISGYIVKNEEKRWYDKDNPLQGAQYDGSVTNNTADEITDWQIQFDIVDRAYMTDSWNGTYTIKGLHVTIDPPKDYNLTIPPHSTMTLGFIMYAPKFYNPENVTLIYTLRNEVTHSWYYYLTWVLAGISGIAMVICIPFMLKIMELEKKEACSRRTIEQILKLFANTIEAKDKYTSGHSARVSWYVRKIARMMGLSVKDQETIYYTAIIHDVGKIGIPDLILTKPGSLESDEMDVMRKHAVKGAEILSDFDSLPGVAEIVRHHHERYDGTGYPDGLKGKEIPLFSRIICIADCFDAMTSDRCYRQKLPIDTVEKELKDNTGTQFDPDIVPFMLEMIKTGEAPLNPDTL